MKKIYMLNSTLQRKKKMLTAIVVMGLVLIAYSCKKDAAADSATVTEADALELTSNAVAPASGGLVLQVNSSIPVYKNTTLSCGVKKDSTITRSSISGASPSYNYTLNWSYLLTCSGVVPSQLAFNFSGTSSYDGAKMSSSDKSTGSFIVTGLLPATTAYTVNTSYVRNGSQTSKIGKNNVFTSTITILSTNVMVDKTSTQILSGTASVVITASSTSGKSFSYAGTITFNGGNKATVVLNSGTSYTIQW